MKRIALYLLPILGSYLLLQPTLYAADLRWSGFGSFVMGKATNQEPLPGGGSSTFKPDAGVPENSNSVYKGSWTMKPDTLLGLQVDINMAEQLNTTTQIISKGAKDFDAEFEWLRYWNAHFTSQSKVCIPTLFFISYNQVRSNHLRIHQIDRQ